MALDFLQKAKRGVGVDRMDKAFKAILFLSLLLVSGVSFAESVTFWKGYVFVGGQPSANGTVLEAFRDNTTLVANFTIGTIDASVSDRYGYYMIPVVVPTLDGGHNVSFRVNGVYPYTGANGSSAALQSVNSFGPNLLNISINLTANGGACRPYSGVTNATSYTNAGCSGGYCVHDLCRAASTNCGDGYCDTGESSSSCSADCGTNATTTTTSGGGSGGSAAAVEETVRIEIVPANTPKTFDITKTANVAVDEVIITTNADASSVAITVKESSKPADAPVPIAAEAGSVYKYVNITLANVSASALSSAKVKFKVTKSWLSDNGLGKNTVKLNRLVGTSWNALATALVNEGASDITYEAETPGFSTFVITAGKVSAAEATPIASPVASPTVVPGTPAITPAPTATPVAAPPLFEVKDNYTLYIFAVVLIVALYIFARMYGKKAHKV